MRGEHRRQRADDAGRDHPRVRGEHPCWRTRRLVRRGSPPRARGAQRACRVPLTAGSPPRARGARFAAAGVGDASRITPACAGSTRGSAADAASVTDHPRVRGEHCYGECVTEAPGSPPRARGAPRRLVAGRGRGSPPRARGAHGMRVAACDVGRDHPRVRGEHVASCASFAGARITPACAGSTVRRLTRDGCRITPACAGSTRRLATVDRGSPPRARGAPATAHRAADLDRDHPRVRGEHDLPHASDPGIGITPACAGSTRAERHRVDDQDHPRVRGEHDRRTSRSCMTGRITPACAGSTSDDSPRGRATGSPPRARGARRAPTPATGRHRDHPRVRGEHTAPPDRGRLTGGSPPRARGAPARRLAGAAG